MSIEGHAVPRRVGLYLRISKNEGEEQSLGTQRQEQDCRAECARRRGWDVVGVYLDDDRSAFHGKRPRYDDLMADLKAGVIDAVMVWHEDRLLRSMTDLEDLVVLVEATGATIATVCAGDVNLETEDGRFRARIQAAVARKESEDKSRRLRRKMKELTERGKSLGGVAPFGYVKTGYKGKDGNGHDVDTRSFAVVPEEAKIVAEVIERVAAGETLTRIADDLTERGVASRRSAVQGWSLSTVRRVALNGRYAGRQMHNGVDSGVSAYPAIVTEILWRQAVAVLTDPKRAKRRSSRKYLLSGGLLVCGKCGTALRSKPTHDSRTGRVRTTYACPPKPRPKAKAPGGCGSVSIDSNEVGRLVVAAVIDHIESAEFAADLRQMVGQTPRAAESAREIEDQQDTITELYQAKKMSKDAYLKAMDRAAEQLAQVQATVTTDTAIAAVSRYAGRKGKLRAEWDDQAKPMSLDRKQAVIRSVLDHVVIAPVGSRGGKVFNPDRVGDPVWK